MAKRPAGASLLLFAVCSLAVAAGAQPPAPAPGPFALLARAVDLPAFSAVQVCLPLSVLIIPSDNASHSANYSLAVDAEQSVLDALSATVENDTLLLETVGGFATSYPVKLAVFLPSTELMEVAVTSPLGDVTIGPGFDVPSLAVSSAFTTGSAYILDSSVGDLYLASSGVGTLFANGSLGNVSVSAGGTATIYLDDVNGNVSVDLAGVSNVVVGAASDTVVITGTTSGVNQVRYNAGQCLVVSNFPFGGPCILEPQLALPTVSPSWSCGLNVSGNFTCGLGGMEEAMERASAGVLTGSAEAPPAIQSVIVTPIVPIPVPAPTPAPTPSPPAPATQVVQPVPTATSPPPTGVTTTTQGTMVTNIGSGNRQAVTSGPGTQQAVAASSPAAASTAENLLQNIEAINAGVGRKLMQGVVITARQLGPGDGYREGNAAEALLARFMEQIENQPEPAAGEVATLSPAAAATVEELLQQLQAMIGVKFSSSSANTRIGRKLKQVVATAGQLGLGNNGNAAEALLAQLLNQSQGAAATAQTVPSTYTSTSGNGIACSYVNGVGGCTPGGQTETVVQPVPVTSSTQQQQPPPTAHGNVVSSGASSVANGNGQGSTYQYTSGPGAAACSSANGVTNCSPGARKRGATVSETPPTNTGIGATTYGSFGTGATAASGAGARACTIVDGVQHCTDGGLNTQTAAVSATTGAQIEAQQCTIVSQGGAYSLNIFG